MFAEFLPFLLVFPLLIALQCGVNDLGLGCGFFLFFLLATFPSLIGFVSHQWLVRSSLHLCLGEGHLLVTHFSIVSPMLAWGGLINLGEWDVLSV